MKGLEFAAQASTCDRRIQVSLTGTADLTVKTELDQFLRELHAEAQRCLAEEVIVDVRRLEFMNSSCLKALVVWISAVQEHADNVNYRIVFISSPSAHWQRRSLHALAALGNGIVSIHTQTSSS